MLYYKNSLEIKQTISSIPLAIFNGIVIHKYPKLG